MEFDKIPDEVKKMMIAKYQLDLEWKSRINDVEKE